MESVPFVFGVPVPLSVHASCSSPWRLHVLEFLGRSRCACAGSRLLSLVADAEGVADVRVLGAEHAEQPLVVVGVETGGGGGSSGGGGGLLVALVGQRLRMRSETGRAQRHLQGEQRVQVVVIELVDQQRVTCV